MEVVPQLNKATLAVVFYNFDRRKYKSSHLIIILHATLLAKSQKVYLYNRMIMRTEVSKGAKLSS